MPAPPLPEIEIRSRGALREWLRANHDSSQTVLLVVYKKHSPYYLPMGELIEELICWGWIDSRRRRLDQDRISVMAAPRNPASTWSAVNKEKVAAARASGAMTPAGEALIATAMQNGMWEFYDDIDRLERPDDLDRALARWLDVWDSWPRTVKRGSLEWIKTAKTAPTREKRIRDIADSAAKGLRPTPFRR